MILTERLLKIAEMVKYKSVADIGTDHAKLPVYLIEKGVCENAVASDVADGPVKACTDTVIRCGMSGLIQIRKGNGLDTLTPGEVDSIVIAGMGGDLISEILLNGDQVVSNAKELILQPMTHIPQLREFFKDNGYKILDEVLVKERNKIYTIIKATKGVNQYIDEFDFIISPILVQNKDKHLNEYVSRLLNKYKSEIEGLSKAHVSNAEQINRIRDIVVRLENIYEIAKDY